MDVQHQIDDYNPFGAPTFSTPAQLQVNSTQSFPLPSNESAITISTFDEQKRMKMELEEKQRQLEERAAELDRIENEQRRRQQYQHDQVRGRDNFPPLPSCCPCKPCFYQDIDMEIPPPNNEVVRQMFILWLAYCVILLLNVGGSLAYLIASNQNTESGTTFGLSIIFAVIFVPGSYVMCFRRLYIGLKKDSNLHFLLFFIFFGIQILINMIQALGINWFASCGWINALATLSNGQRAAAGIMLFIASLFTLLSVVEVVMIVRIHRLYRNKGGNFQSARDEAISEAVSSAATVRGPPRNFGSTY